MIARSGRGRHGTGARPAGFRKAIQSLVATDNGENNALEPFNDGKNVATLQNMYHGIIGESGHFLDPPQVCFMPQSAIATSCTVPNIDHGRWNARRTLHTRFTLGIC